MIFKRKILNNKQQSSDDGHLSEGNENSALKDKYNEYTVVSRIPSDDDKDDDMNDSVMDDMGNAEYPRTDSEDDKYDDYDEDLDEFYEDALPEDISYDNNDNEEYDDIDEDIEEDNDGRQQDRPDNRIETLDTVLGQHTVITNSIIDNNNVFICGSSGSGKTSRFVIPNILSKECSYIVADPGGNLYRETSKYMRSCRGGESYNVLALNLIDPYHSMHYNPVAYIKNEADIRYFAEVLARASGQRQGRQRQSPGGDPFWDLSSNLMMQGLTFMLYEDPGIMPDIRTLSTMGEIAATFQAKEYDGEKTVGQGILDEIEKIRPDAKCVDIMKKVCTAPGRTFNSILITMLVNFNNLCTNEIMELTRKDDLELENLSKQPTILYVMYDETDRTKNVISNMLYMQCLRLLYHQAQDGGLRYPVRFIIDDFSNTDIPDFELYIRTCRKYGISLCPVVQSPGQLLERYPEPTAKDIMSNCSMHLFTGSYDLNELDTAAKLFRVDRSALEKLHRFEFYASINGKIKKIKGIIPEKQRYSRYIKGASGDISRDFRCCPVYKKLTFDINTEAEYPKSRIFRKAETEPTAILRKVETKPVAESDVYRENIPEEDVSKEGASEKSDSREYNREQEIKEQLRKYKDENSKMRNLRIATRIVNGSTCFVTQAKKYMSYSEKVYADFIQSVLEEEKLDDRISVLTQQSLITLFAFSRKNGTEMAPPYRNTADMRCDIVLIDNDAADSIGLLAGFEIDGPSHTEEMQKALDKYKDDVFRKAGIPLIRLPLDKERDELEYRIRKSIDQIKEDFCIRKCINDITTELEENPPSSKPLKIKDADTQDTGDSDESDGDLVRISSKQ